MANGNVEPLYEFPEYEKHLMHVQLETPEFDSVTGEKKSLPYVQKFYVKEFEQIESVSGFAAFKVNILHDPSRGAALKVEKAYVAGDASKPDSIVNVPTGANEVAKSDINVMRKAELLALYKEVYGEDASEDATVASLKEDIKLRQDYLAEEAKQD